MENQIDDGSRRPGVVGLFQIVPYQKMPPGETFPRLETPYWEPFRHPKCPPGDTVNCQNVPQGLFRKRPPGTLRGFPPPPTWRCPPANIPNRPLIWKRPISTPNPRKSFVGCSCVCVCVCLFVCVCVCVGACAGILLVGVLRRAV